MNREEERGKMAIRGEEPALVILAAGMGSRYGGLKQIDPIDPYGNLIVDFSIYDAVKAGFRKVVFLITREMEDAFRNRIGNRISNRVETEYAYQSPDDLPEGFCVPPGRVKPWGTGHAVLSCRNAVRGPFAVVNADDYYGRRAFEMIYRELSAQRDDEKCRFCMVGYRLENTLTENGSVSRGICRTDGASMLTGVTERTRVEKRGRGAAFTEDGGKTWVSADPQSIVSMNLWGFSSGIFRELSRGFRAFLETEAERDPLKSEYFLPGAVDGMLKSGRASVRVLKSEDRWYGMTYREDKQAVADAVAELKRQGVYPERLWGGV